MKISKIKSNPNNPRIIKDDKFVKLCKSISDLPKMMELRPIVVDENFVVQGGNMRLKALIELGYKEIPDTWVKQANDFTEEELKEFIIKDNVGFGEWDWDDLANNWDSEKIDEWGLNIPNWASGSDLNNMSENDLDFTEEFDPIGTSKGLQRVVFIFDGKEEAESYLKSINVDFDKRNMAWQVNMSTQSIL